MWKVVVLYFHTYCIIHFIVNGGGGTTQAMEESDKISVFNIHTPKAAVIHIFITGHPVIAKWGDYNTFNIPTAAEYISE